MALPADFAAVIAGDERNAKAWAELAEFLGERPGWHFARLPVHIGPGLFWFGPGDRRLEIRPWGGRFETTVNFLHAGDDSQFFFERFEDLAQWLVRSGEPYVTSED